MTKTINYNTIAYHSLFWLLYCILMAALIGMNGNQAFLFVLSHFIISVPAFALFAYPLLYIIIPGLITKRLNFIRIAIAVITISTIASAFKLLINHVIFYGLVWPKSLEPSNWFNLKLIIQNLLPIWIPAMFMAVQKYTTDWLKESKAKAELEKENIETELKMLKNQLNPHFLFNTLNNLYSLALMKSDKTPEMISRLSDIFQFILYECNAKHISLKKEMNLIQNYVELQQLRYGNRLDFSIKTDVGIENFRIAPMILFTFVENCFKHGSGGDPGIPWIKLSIERKNDKLRFTAENSRPLNHKQVENGNGGIGLDNLKKRLNLLYLNKYELQVLSEDRFYKVDLCIEEL